MLFTKPKFPWNKYTSTLLPQTLVTRFLQTIFITKRIKKRLQLIFPGFFNALDPEVTSVKTDLNIEILKTGTKSF